MTAILEEVKKLSRDEKILLVQQVWDDLADQSEPFQLSPDQADELRASWSEHQQNPQASRSWEDVRADLLQKL